MYDDDDISSIIRNIFVPFAPVDVHSNIIALGRHDNDTVTRWNAAIRRQIISIDAATSKRVQEQRSAAIFVLAFAFGSLATADSWLAFCVLCCLELAYDLFFAFCFIQSCCPRFALFGNTRYSESDMKISQNPKSKSTTKIDSAVALRCHRRVHYFTRAISTWL